jgi:glutaconate CoA-transferase subunit A
MATRFTELGSLAAMIPNGALLGIGGFQLNRAPMALVGELVAQGKSDLRIVSAPNPLPLDALVGAGLVAEVECGFIGFQYEHGFVIAPAIRRAIERGQLTFHERDVYETLQGLRAAALGEPFLPLVGTPANDYLGILEHERETGAESADSFPIRRALQPDIALLHAQAVDGDGNLRIDDPHADALIGQASRSVIATAEEMVDRVSNPTIPGSHVAGVAVVPQGAFPTACHGFYERSPGGIAEYLEASTEGGEIALSQPGASRSDGVHAIDRILVGMARSISDEDVVTTGVASATAMLATELARRSAAPRLSYINCVGAVDPRITTALSSSVDTSLLEGCSRRISLPDVFDSACRGDVDLMFFGAAQVDQEARLNLTCIGPYAAPKVKLAGPAGSPTMRALVRKVVITVNHHSPRTLVREVDFVTSAAGAANESTTLITNLGIFGLDGGILRVVSRHEGVSADELEQKTGFPVAGAMDRVTPEPSAREMELLNELDPLGLRYQWG